MHLVVHHVVQLNHIDVADRNLLMELFAGATVIDVHASVFGKTGLAHQFVNLINTCTVEDRGGEPHSEFLAGPAEDGFINLSQVHTGRHAQRVQDDVHRCTVSEERHILLLDDLGDDTLVTVTTGHLVTHAQFALVGDIDLGHLDDTVGQLVTDGGVELLTHHLGEEGTLLNQVVADDFRNQPVELGVVGPLRYGHVGVVDFAEELLGELGTLGHHHVLGVVVDVVGNLAVEQFVQLGDNTLFQCGHILFEGSVDFLQNVLVFRLAFAVLHHAGEGLGIDDHTLH